MGLLSRMSRAAKTLSKYYSPFTWRDKPSIESPINAVHLNHIEDGINEMDNRILILAQDKADAADMANVIIDFTMDDTTGVMTFTRFDGSTFTHDTAVEKIALNCYLEGDNFVLELADGTKQKVSLSKFIDTYTFTSTDRIRFTVNGKNISADIPDGKITLAKLEPTVMSTIRQYTLDAQTSKGVAEQAASTAQGWAIGGTGFEGNNAKYYASKSQRYAVGGVEEGDAEDNAKVYCNKAKEYADQCAGAAGFDGKATSVSATDTHGLGSTNVQGQLDALADGLNNIDMSASSVTAVDIQGIAVNAGESSTVQALIDVIANKVMTKLLEKTAIVQTESTATNKVPSSAYLKQVKDSIDSNLANKNVIGTYNIPNITGVSTAPENIASGYHNVAKYSNGQCIYSALVYVYTSAISNSVIGTISSQYAPKQDVSAYVYDFAGNRFLMVLISSDGTIKLMTLEGTAIPESAVKVRGSIVF